MSSSNAYLFPPLPTPSRKRSAGDGVRPLPTSSHPPYGGEGEEDVAPADDPTADQPPTQAGEEVNVIPIDLKARRRHPANRRRFDGPDAA